MSFISQTEPQFYLAAVQDLVFLPAYRKELISCIDLTQLNDTDTAESTAALCQKAVTAYGQVAAVCIAPRFVKQAVALLSGSAIKVATVANFPTGSSPLAAVLQEIAEAIQEGADEIDVVFPYHVYLQGERDAAISFIRHCKSCCSSVTLKVILETGAIQDLNLIAQATQDAIEAGADFIKTSTGKLAQGASLEAAAAILLTIKKASQNGQRRLGFKAAGGIREPLQALRYLRLAQNIMGADWPTPQTFRLGASQLLDHLLSGSVS